MAGWATCSNKKAHVLILLVFVTGNNEGSLRVRLLLCKIRALFPPPSHLAPPQIQPRGRSVPGRPFLQASRFQQHHPGSGVNFFCLGCGAGTPENVLKESAGETTLVEGAATSL